jgi:adenylyltransferase/sulfurtransferase
MSPPSLTENELDYYSRQIVLKNMGLSGQRKLKDSKVCVVGAGGLGSPILMQLSSMGVGYIRIIDRDIVDISNLQRQFLYGTQVLGVPKVEAAKERLSLLNPFIEIDPIPMPITPNNADKLIQGVDVVVDALDAMAPRYALNRACQKLGIPFIHGGVIMQNGTASTIIPGETVCLECFQGGIRDEELPSCAVQGVHPSVISLIGSIQVSEAVKIILGEEPVLLNKLLFADLSDLSIEKIVLSKLESCPVCGTGEGENIDFSTWEEVCGREEGRTFVYNPEVNEEVDLEKVKRNAVKMGYKILVHSELGLTFEKQGIRGSLLVSGVSIFEGLRELEDARQFRQLLLR